uniref:Uncharacterized protein n=1 Tax=Panagrellus redivivus TaxID=6233 RepID=A0A7E4ZZU2_PANRE
MSPRRSAVFRILLTFSIVMYLLAVCSAQDSKADREKRRFGLRLPHIVRYSPNGPYSEMQKRFGGLRLPKLLRMRRFLIDFNADDNGNPIYDYGNSNL